MVLKKTLDIDIDNLIKIIAKSHNLNPDKLKEDVENKAKIERRRRQQLLQNKINETYINYHKNLGHTSYSNIPDRLIGLTFNNIINGDNSNSIQEIMAKLKNKSRKGFLLWGTVGSLKYELLGVIGQNLVNAHGEKIYYNSEENFLSEIRRAYNPTSEISEEEVINEICNNDSILIEEFGQATGEWSTKTIKKLIDEIWNRNKKLYISMSYKPIDLLRKWGYNQTTNILPYQITIKINDLCDSIFVKEKELEINNKF